MEFELCRQYQELRHDGKVKIMRAWLDEDECGYLCRFQTESGEINKSYLGTKFFDEALYIMRSEIKKMRKKMHTS